MCVANGNCLDNAKKINSICWHSTLEILYYANIMLNVFLMSIMPKLSWTCAAKFGLKVQYTTILMHMYKIDFIIMFLVIIQINPIECQSSTVDMCTCMMYIEASTPYYKLL